MLYPALDIRGVDPDLALALCDDFSPTAVEDIADGIAVFFPTSVQRAAARDALLAAWPDARLAVREVDDEDWARRSQQNLTAVTVGRIRVTPPWHLASGDGRGVTAASDARNVVIQPSMGFGTGHHATTRLCLDALQQLNLRGRMVLDVGTGSGVLALAASLLGAADVRGIDIDADAIASADENLALNGSPAQVRFETLDMRAAALPAADLVVANLTGGVLVQNAPLLTSAVRPGGSLIVSGLQSHERADVTAAFAALRLAWSGEEAGWVGLRFDV